MAHAPAVPGLMYHEVANDPAASGFQRRGALPYVCTSASFLSHLELIAASGRRPALADSLDLASPGRSLLLTFDDGGRSALTAADALAQRGWHGHFFIVTNRLGSRGFLSRDGVRYLRSCGHVVGSHSHTHPDIFPALAPEEMRTEWQTSRGILEQLLGESCPVASLPGGDLSPAVLDSVRAAGFTVLFTSEPWLQPRRTGDCVLLGRYAIKAGLRPATLAALLALQGWEQALLRRRVSVIVRRTLGPLYRLYVHRRTASDLAPGAR